MLQDQTRSQTYVWQNLLPIIEVAVQNNWEMVQVMMCYHYLTIDVYELNWVIILATCTSVGEKLLSVIHRFNYEKEAAKVYRSKLMLYLPWRNENTVLLGGYTDFRSHYEDKQGDILANEQKFSTNAVVINEALDDLKQYGQPQHAWDQVAPGICEEEARHQRENVEELLTI